MALVAPLNLEYWLVNVLSGSWPIFIALIFFATMILAARFKMSNMTLIFIMTLFVVLMAPFAPALMVIFIILGGFVLYWIISKPIRQ